MMTSSRNALMGAIVLLAVCWCGVAGAQESIPKPGDLALDAPAAVLRIDKPVDGERVETPFLVTGIAAPGSRLELWLGDTLNRVFMADADGRFTSAVSAPTPGSKVWVHQLDSSGQRVQSDGVSVVWSGEAPPLPAPLVGGEHGIDPFAATPATTTATGLPRVSDLSTRGDGGAPVPPPPSADPFASEATGEAPDVMLSDDEYEAPITDPRPDTPTRGVRGIAEAGGGLAGAAVFGLGGALLGVGLGAAGDTSGWGSLIGGVLGGMAGLVVGLPVGVVVTGNLMDGNGQWWAVVVGELSGLLVGGLIAAATSFNAPAVGVFSVFAFPVAGAVVGYELSSDASAWEAKYGKQARSLRPIITPTKDGGVTVGFGFAF